MGKKTRKHVDALLDELDHANGENGENGLGGPHDQASECSSSKTCVYHPIMRTVVKEMRENSHLKWKVILGLIPVMLSISALSLHSFSTSTGRVMAELASTRAELVQNQEKFRDQMNANTNKIASIETLLRRMERDMERSSDMDRMDRRTGGR